MHRCKYTQQKKKPLTSLCFSRTSTFCHFTAQLGHIWMRMNLIGLWLYAKIQAILDFADTDN